MLQFLSWLLGFKKSTPRALILHFCCDTFALRLLKWPNFYVSTEDFDRWLVEEHPVSLLITWGFPKKKVSQVWFIDDSAAWFEEPFLRTRQIPTLLELIMGSSKVSARIKAKQEWIRSRNARLVTSACEFTRFGGGYVVSSGVRVISLESPPLVTIGGGN